LTYFKFLSWNVPRETDENQEQILKRPVTRRRSLLGNVRIQVYTKFFCPL